MAIDNATNPPMSANVASNDAASNSNPPTYTNLEMGGGMNDVSAVLAAEGRDVESRRYLLH